MKAENHQLIQNPTLPTIMNNEDQIQESNLYYVNRPSQEAIIQNFTQKYRDNTKKQILNKNLDPENKKMAFFQQLQKLQLSEDKHKKTDQYFTYYKKEHLQKSVNSSKGQYKCTKMKIFERDRINSERTNQTYQQLREYSIIDDIVQNQDIIAKQKGLLEKVQDLKKLKLLKQYKFNHYCLPGVGKSPYVFNDTHSKCTNPGYSRNIEGGKFFTR
ncbi:unnamed protein product [Paramecium sonneborni]|uniref:Uncharacterized protein n=1 Tax=Paramecium sonneborni TaxID=65129 RepID=A0A8S1K5E2_9CILI|nr:unnamed protein product [Paramecium sonneborni]CAD8048144.1 unnamed protein product [Paramecium sonneborni]